MPEAGTVSVDAGPDKEQVGSAPTVAIRAGCKGTKGAAPRRLPLPSLFPTIATMRFPLLCATAGEFCTEHVLLSGLIVFQSSPVLCLSVCLWKHRMRAFKSTIVTNFHPVYRTFRKGLPVVWMNFTGLKHTSHQTTLVTRTSLSSWAKVLVHSALYQAISLATLTFISTTSSSAASHPFRREIIVISSTVTDTA